jgi:hypothetical protein
MKLYLVKTDFALYPAHASDADELKKLASGEVMEVEIKKARNWKFHKKFFALIKVGFESQQMFDEMTSYRYWITMKAGHYTMHGTGKGVMYLPKSIAFDKMDDLEFSDLFRDVQNAIIREHKITAEQINENLELFM